jgi:predicted methyltransferase
MQVLKKKNQLHFLIRSLPFSVSKMKGMKRETYIYYVSGKFWFSLDETLDHFIKVVCTEQERLQDPWEGKTVGLRSWRCKTWIP